MSFHQADEGQQWRFDDCRGRFNHDVEDARLFELMEVVREVLNGHAQ